MRTLPADPWAIEDCSALTRLLSCPLAAQIASWGLVMSPRTLWFSAPPPQHVAEDCARMPYCAAFFPFAGTEVTALSQAGGSIRLNDPRRERLLSGGQARMAADDHVVERDH